LTDWLQQSRPSDRLVRQTSGDQVAQFIRRMIFDGTLRAGARLPQEAIAKALGVSRIPVREALVALEKEGRVTIESHRGAFVAPIDEESVVDNSELYGMIYGFVAHRAAQRATPELLERLDSLATSIAATADGGAMMQWHEEFLDAIMEAGCAPRLAHVLRGLRLLVVDNFFEAIPQAAEATREGILAVIDAIRRRDPEGAAEEQVRLQRRNAELVLRVYRERGVFVEPAR
jgi:DNA-binding GntR family transcriptional regulator